ncbi:MAG: hypothetical protein IPK81_24005 [Rhodospirillales bacterium]|nr:MAG: hypothetical protein IPK81_24005 [Rhodospirillales bacterium]
MRRRIAAALIAATSAVSAAAPASAAVITSAGAESPYSYQEYVAAADGREFPVELHGDVFPGASSDALAPAVLRIMDQARPASPATRFARAGTMPAGSPDYRLVIVFGPARNLSHHTLCAAPQKIAHEPVKEGQARLSIAFCRGTDLMSRAVATTAARNVDDPAFRQMFVELFPVLFPKRNPFMNGRGSGFPRQ